jgi:hypothetical protein
MRRFFRTALEKWRNAQGFLYTFRAFLNEQAQSTGGQDDLQTETRSHFFAVQRLSCPFGDFLQSKDESAPAEIAHDA